MAAIRRIVGWLAALAALATAGLVLVALTRSRPQDLPWTPLDLAQPAGPFTAAKIAALG